MSTHFHDYNSVEGSYTACGRYFTKAIVPLPKGIAITTKVGDVSCQRCIRSERFRLAKARVSRLLDAPIPQQQEPHPMTDQTATDAEVEIGRIIDPGAWWGDDIPNRHQQMRVDRVLAKVRAILDLLREQQQPDPMESDAIKTMRSDYIGYRKIMASEAGLIIRWIDRAFPELRAQPSGDR